MNSFTELLEPRRLLAATVTLDANGFLRIVGDSADNVASLSRFQGGQIQVTVDGTSTLFDAAKVQKFGFYGMGGNDSITLGNVNLRAYLDGGTGNDSLSGAQGDAADR